jgi:hypothetical protein
MLVNGHSSINKTNQIVPQTIEHKIDHEQLTLEIQVLAWHRYKK